MKRSFLRLLWFEWKKNFLSPWMLLFLVVLLGLNAWKLQEAYEKADCDYEDVYEEFYAKWNGTITTEKVGELMTIYAPLEAKFQSMSLRSQQGTGTYTDTEWDDYNFFCGEFKTEMEYDYLYVNEARQIAGKAQTLADYYAGAGFDYQAAESRAIANAFSGRSIPKFADTRYLEAWLKHDYSSLLVLLLCLFGLSSVFVTERESQMYMLQRTAVLGGKVNAAAKLTASVLFVLVVCGLFYGEDYLVLQLLSGHWEALDSPVYAIRLLETTTLTMTIGEYILWSIAVRTLGVLGCGWMILLASCLMKQTLTAFTAGLGSLLALIILQEECARYPWAKWFNPVELIQIRELLIDTEYVNVCGWPVPLHGFVIGGIVVTMAALTLAILRFQPGQTQRRWRV